MDLVLAEKLVNSDGIPGHEKEVYQIMKDYAKDICDETYSDNLGSFVAHKKGKGPKIMLAGHMDEVGFVVKRIDDNGFIFFAPAGGWWNQVLLAKRVRITNRNGEKFIGIIGSKAPHVLSVEERNKPVAIEKMFIDLGVESKQEVLDLGIRIGDMITPDSEFMVMNNENYLAGKAWDNRIGCQIALEVLKNVEKQSLGCDLYAVGTVQEEVGLRGAKTVTNLVKPDLAIAIDTGIAGCTPGITQDEANTKIGDGPLVLIMDASLIAHVGLRNLILDLALDLNIPVQEDFILKGGTDAGAIHVSQSGIPSLTVAIATRYLHSHTSVINKQDVDLAISLLTEFIKRLNQQVLSDIL